MTLQETVDHSLWRTRPDSFYCEQEVPVRLSKLELEQAIMDKIATDFTDRQQIIRTLIAPMFDYFPELTELSTEE